MQESIWNVLDEIDQKWICLQIDFENDSWRKNIPSEPGWYVIKTNTPLLVLKSVNTPVFERRAHRNIPQAINNVIILRNLGVVINQSSTEDYVVYNGEANNLKARAREHECGHYKTYCLGLSNYKEDLGSYRWSFCYVTASSCSLLTGNGKDKLLRTAIEQFWRARHGWPILCHR